ncbi:hypothetical protein DPMN_178217 [Dreissena polymorpha]|uniref:Uncharacterized protein n=1 Tax=Dreissena polymorpha TaxID=45954 RepID=A0A9D4EA68_DREPO|nr:hypothetical protein DPMN_178217 [Dreissena polymorpha]
MPPSSVANYNINSSSDCHVISSTGQPQGRQPFQPLQQSTTHIATFSSTNRVMMPLNMVDKNLMLHWDDFLKDILRWNPEWFDEKCKTLYYAFILLVLLICYARASVLTLNRHSL